MEIKVGVYTIYSDKYCMWITKTYKPKGKGAKKEFVEERISGYHDNIESLMESFIDRRLRSSDAASLKEHLKEIDRATRDAKRIVKELIKHGTQN